MHKYLFFTAVMVVLLPIPALAIDVTFSQDILAPNSQLKARVNAVGKILIESELLGGSTELDVTQNQEVNLGTVQDPGFYDLKIVQGSEKVRYSLGILPLKVATGEKPKFELKAINVSGRTQVAPDGLLNKFKNNWTKKRVQ